MNEPIIIDPMMADAVIANIQKGLKEKIPWLDAAFGRAERIIKQINGRNYYLPAVYTGSGNTANEYLELSPDSKIGNFCFFWMLDPQRIEWRPNIPGTVKEPFALIFWFDLRKVYHGADNRNVAALEAEVLNVLNGKFHMPIGALTITKVYHLAENIYREFTLDAVDNQFLMHPYAGFRLEGELIYDQPCL